MVGSIDEELGIPVVGGIADAMDFDAARIVVAHAAEYALFVAISVGIAADEAGGVGALAVAVLDKLYPGRLLSLIRVVGFWCCGQATVGGIHQRSTFGDVDADVQGTIEQLTAYADDGSFHSLVGKCGCSVALAGGGIGSPAPFVTTIGGTGPRSATHSLGISLAGDDASILVAQDDGAAVAVELEGSLVILDVVGA